MRSTLHTAYRLRMILLPLCRNTLQTISNCKTYRYVIFTSNTHTHAQPPLFSCLSVATATQHSPSHRTDSTWALTDLWQTYSYNCLFTPTQISQHAKTSSGSSWHSHLTVLPSKPLAADACISPEVQLHLYALTLLHLSHPTTDAPIQTGSALAGVRRHAGGLSWAGAWCQRGPESTPHPKDEEERKYEALHESGTDAAVSQMCHLFSSLHTLV